MPLLKIIYLPIFTRRFFFLSFYCLAIVLYGGKNGTRLAFLYRYEVYTTVFSIYLRGYTFLGKITFYIFSVSKYTRSIYILCKNTVRDIFLERGRATQYTAWMVDRKKQMSPVNQRAVLRGIKNRTAQQRWSIAHDNFFFLFPSFLPFFFYVFF